MNHTNFKLEHTAALASAVSAFVSKLESLGFSDCQRDEKNPLAYADFGCVMKDVAYLHRAYNGQHQYVTLCGYAGNFIEAVVHVYQKPFASRSKAPQPLLCSTLRRTLPELLDALDHVYALPESPAKKA